MSATEQEFAAFKHEVLEFAVDHDACESGIIDHNTAQTPQEWADTCAEHLAWLHKYGMAVSLPDVKHIGGDADFRGCKGELPALQNIGGYADLRWYTGELPALKNIGGRAYFRGYTGELPALKNIGGDAYFSGYHDAYQLLTRIEAGTLTVGGKIYK